MQDPSEIDRTYLNPDPWGFKKNIDDLKRKSLILSACRKYAPENGFVKALDLGCGEAWITKDLPATIRCGYEISGNAKSRFPPGVIVEDVPNGKYDLVLTTGTLYEQYDYKLFFHLMQQHSSLIIVSCNIKSWERPELSDLEWHKNYLGAKQVYEDEFPYREYVQKLRIFKKL